MFANDKTKDILFKMNKTTKIRVKTIKTPVDYKSLSKNDEAKLLKKIYIWVQTWFDYSANKCLSVWILCEVIHAFLYLPVPPSGRFCFSTVYNNTN